MVEVLILRRVNDTVHLVSLRAQQRQQPSKRLRCFIDQLANLDIVPQGVVAALPKREAEVAAQQAAFMKAGMPLRWIAEHCPQLGIGLEDHAMPARGEAVITGTYLLGVLRGK